MDPFGEIAFSPGEEAWIEYGPPEDRRRVGFHDYAALYAVPGLYERVFYEELGMCSAREVVATFGGALAAAGVDPGGLRVLDFGAGNGMGGGRLRAIGAGSVVGLDLEPQARLAAQRDRPGVYDHFHVADVGALGEEELAAVRGEGFDALVAVAALGFGHAPANVLERALGLVVPGGWIAFAISTQLVPGAGGVDGETWGYPAFLEALFGDGRARRVAEHAYNHRMETDGSEHPALAVVARLAG